MKENNPDNSEKNEPDNSIIRDKITLGLELAFKKLVKEKKKNGGVFVFCENGVIKKIKASDMPD